MPIHTCVYTHTYICNVCVFAQVDANQQLQRQVTSLQQERSALVQQVEGQQREIQKLAGLKEHILRSLGAEDPMPTHHWAGAGDSVLRPSFPQRRCVMKALHTHTLYSPSKYVDDDGDDADDDAIVWPHASTPSLQFFALHWHFLGAF